MQYTSQAQVENFLGRSLKTGEQAVLPSVVYSIERKIDKELGTTFKNTASLYGQVRYYHGGKRHVDIDPCQNVTDVSLINPQKNIFVSLATYLYVLQPLNEPVSRLLTLRYGRFPSAFSNVQVTADFTEYGAEEAGVPSDIQQIATRVVGAIFMMPESVIALQSENIEGHSYTVSQGYRGAEANAFFKDPIVDELMSARKQIILDDAPNLEENDGWDTEDFLGLY